MKDRILKVRGLGKSYLVGTPLEVQVLREVDLDIEAGEFVSIIGESGSGKSTLLNILGALDQPTEGVVEVAGVDIGQLDSLELARLRNAKVGFVFQFHHLLIEFTCLENALMPIAISKGRPPAQDVERVTRLLERVGLGSQLKKKANQISGGQQQRVAIIRALANRPRLVLADEPTGNLDSGSSAEVFTLMREMTREQGVTFLMVTHDDRLAREADRTIQIEDGRVTEL